MLPLAVPTNIMPLPACAGVDAVKLSLVVYTHPSVPYVALYDCIVDPTGSITAPVAVSDGAASGAEPSSESHRYEPVAPSYVARRASVPLTRGATVTTPASGSTMGEMVLAASRAFVHLTMPDCPASATTVAADVTKYTELSAPSAGAASAPLPSDCVHCTEPEGESDTASPVSEPEMMLLSLLMTGSVDVPPLTGVFQLAAPVDALKLDTPAVVPTTKLAPPDTMDGVDTLAVPAPALL